MVNAVVLALTDYTSAPDLVMPSLHFGESAAPHGLLPASLLQAPDIRVNHRECTQQRGEHLVLGMVRKYRPIVTLSTHLQLRAAVRVAHLELCNCILQ